MGYKYVNDEHQHKQEEDKKALIDFSGEGDDETVRNTAAKVLDRLVDSIFLYVHRSIVFFPIVATICGWLGGQPPSQFINPLFVSLAGAIPMLFKGSPLVQTGIALLTISFPIVRHAIFFQGCTACHVPALYGFVPCATGFLFRTTNAILVSTIYVMSVIVIIFAIDLTGNCPSEPIDPSDKGSIIADRFMPIFMLIGGIPFWSMPFSNNLRKA